MTAEFTVDCTGGGYSIDDHSDCPPCLTCPKLKCGADCLLLEITFRNLNQTSQFPGTESTFNQGVGEVLVVECKFVCPCPCPAQRCRHRENTQVGAQLTDTLKHLHERQSQVGLVHNHQTARPKESRVHRPSPWTHAVTTVQEA